MRLAVIGGGWAGLAAAVQAVQSGHEVTLFEMAQQLGGRARRVELDGLALDNGQHILIGAYTETLQLMRTVGVDVSATLVRRPLELVYPDGSGLQLPPGKPLPALLRGVLGARGWSWRERLSLLTRATGWAARRFRCDPQLSVDQLTAKMPTRLREDLIDPLCVAALNTPPQEASAAVFLRVLKDALLGGPGSADLLLPRRSLSDLLPHPAQRWLQAAGADLRLSARVMDLRANGTGWSIDAEHFDRVVLACSAKEAARLTRGVAPAWSRRADAFVFEPIVTVYLQSEGTRLPFPMTALRGGRECPAQFVFDHGGLGGTAGLFAAVASGARAWAVRGPDETAAAVRRQLESGFPAGTWAQPPVVLRTMVERRATFLCQPGLQRPAADIAPGLAAAGDYIDGPYPATLEGAVRAGHRAAGSVFAMQNERNSVMIPP